MLKSAWNVNGIKESEVYKMKAKVRRKMLKTIKADWVNLCIYGLEPFWVSLKTVPNFAKYRVLRKWLFLKATFAKHLISRSGVRSSHAPIYLLFSDCGGVAWANGAQLAECG